MPIEHVDRQVSASGDLEAGPASGVKGPCAAACKAIAEKGTSPHQVLDADSNGSRDSTQPHCEPAIPPDSSHTLRAGLPESCIADWRGSDGKNGLKQPAGAPGMVREDAPNGLGQLDLFLAEAERYVKANHPQRKKVVKGAIIQKPTNPLTRRQPGVEAKTSGPRNLKARPRRWTRSSELAC